MAITEAGRRARDRYDAAHYDKIGIKIPKGYSNKIKQAAAAFGVSASEYIRRAILAALTADGISIDSDQQD